MTEPARALDVLLEDPELRRLWDEQALPRAIGDVLIGLRRAAGLTQAELAGAAGWDPSYVSRLERGSRAVPSPETVARYAAACGFAAAYGFRNPFGTPVAEIPLGSLARDVQPPDSPAIAARREATERRRHWAEQVRSPDATRGDDPARSSAGSGPARRRGSGRRRTSLAKS